MVGRALHHSSCVLVAQAGVDKAQQCQLLSACLECWAEVKEEIDEAALRKLENFVERYTSLR